MPFRHANFRKYYIPENYSLLASDPDLGVEIWGDDKVSAIAFHGKAQKPDWHHRFSSQARRAEKIDEFIASQRASAERKIAERKARAAWQHGLKVGDIFRCSWGYDQTNIDFYEVVEVKGKAVVVREIAQQRDTTAWMQGTCVPAPGRYIGEPMTKIPQRGWQGEPSLAIHSFASAQLFRPIAEAGAAKVFAPSNWTAYA